MDRAQMRCKDPGGRSVPKPCHQKSDPLQAARRIEPRTENTGRQGTVYSSAHETRSTVQGAYREGQGDQRRTATGHPGGQTGGAPTLRTIRLGPWAAVHGSRTTKHYQLGSLPLGRGSRSLIRGARPMDRVTEIKPAPSNTLRARPFEWRSTPHGSRAKALGRVTGLPGSWSLALSQMAK